MGIEGRWGGGKKKETPTRAEATRFVTVAFIFYTATRMFRK